MNKTVTIVGGGLTGCTLAYLLKNKGYYVKVFEKANKIGGLCKDSTLDGVIYNPHGPHIFHTNNPMVWKFITGLIEMRPFVHRVLSYYQGRFFHYPISEVTMENEGWKVDDVFHKFVRNYTRKMWGKELDELGQEVHSRIRINKGGEMNFFEDKFQGHPYQGYNPLFEKLIKGIEVKYDCNLTGGTRLKSDILIVTTPLDEYFSNCYGELKWTGIRSESILCHQDSFQHNSIINYPEPKFPYLRITEFKKLTGQQHPHTVIGIDYPDSTLKHYPVDNPKNQSIANKYKKLADKRGIILAGRLGTYKYMNMDEAVNQAITIASKL